MMKYGKLCMFKSIHSSTMYKSIQFHMFWKKSASPHKFEMLSLNFNFFVWCNKWFNENDSVNETAQLTTTRFAEIQANQLHHIRFQEIYIPPWDSFSFGQWTCIWCIKCWCWTIDGFLWDSSTFGRYLHWCLTSRYIQHWKFTNSNKNALIIIFIQVIIILYLLWILLQIIGNAHNLGEPKFSL